MIEEQNEFGVREGALRNLFTNGALFVIGAVAALGFDALDEKLSWFYYLVVIWLAILVLHAFIALRGDRLIARSDALSRIAPARTPHSADAAALESGSEPEPATETAPPAETEEQA